MIQPGIRAPARCAAAGYAAAARRVGCAACVPAAGGTPSSGQRASKLRPAPEPSGDRQGPPEALLARRRVDERATGSTRVEVLADPAELLARPWGDAGHRIHQRVPRAEGGLRRGRVQPGRRRAADAGAGAEHDGEQAGLLGQVREPALLPRLAVAGDDDRAPEPRAGDARLGRPLRERRRGQRHGGRDAHAGGKGGDSDQPAQHGGSFRLCLTPDTPPPPWQVPALALRGAGACAVPVPARCRWPRGVSAPSWRWRARPSW